MLQIASGMYFTTTDLHETLHRRAFYSNGIRMNADDIDLPIGTLRFANGRRDVQPLMIEAVDRLPKVNPDGSKAFHVATGGDELIDDVAYVVAFGLDVVMLPDPALAERVVEGTPVGGGRGRKLFRHVLDPQRFVTDDEIAELREFCTQLLALRRPEFEAAMRAIRRVSDAITLTASDVTLAYTLMVAALESLSGSTEAIEMPWEDYDGRKRKIIEVATNGLPDEQRDAVHAAILEADKAGAGRKFREFILEHVNDDYFRSGAVGAVRPVQRVGVLNALRFAYEVRSRSLHELRNLAPELWVVTGADDTTWHGRDTVLTLEGLHRLCQHVIRDFVRRAPTDLDTDFQKNYRDALPGIVKMRLAPQHWVHTERHFAVSRAPSIFSALVSMVTATIAGTKSAVVDMTNPLERIEQLLPDVRKDSNRTPLIATYALWQRFMPPDFQRPDPGGICDEFSSLLKTPSVYAAAVAVLTGDELPWNDTQLAALIDEREKSLMSAGKSTLELPPRLDAAFHIELARRKWAAGDHDAAEARMAKAVELLPGDEALMELEKDARAGVFEDFSLLDFIADRRTELDNEAQQDQPNNG